MTFSTANHARPLYYLQSRKNLPLLGMVALRIAVLLTKWDQRIKTRRSLLKLEDSTLKDIGITRGEANTEANRSFWKD